MPKQWLNVPCFEIVFSTFGFICILRTNIKYSANEFEHLKYTQSILRFYQFVHTMFEPLHQRAELESYNFKLICCCQKKTATGYFDREYKLQTKVPILRVTQKHKECKAGVLTPCHMTRRSYTLPALTCTNINPKHLFMVTLWHKCQRFLPITMWMTCTDSAFHIHYICARWESSKGWMDNTGQAKPVNMGKVNHCSQHTHTPRGWQHIAQFCSCNRYVMQKCSYCEVNVQTGIQVFLELKSNYWIFFSN